MWSRIHFCFVQYLKIFKWKLLRKCKNTFLCRNEVCAVCDLRNRSCLNSIGLILEKARLVLGLQVSVCPNGIYWEVTEALEGSVKMLGFLLLRPFWRKENFYENCCYSQKICKPFFFQSHSSLNIHCAQMCHLVGSCALYTCFPSLSMIMSLHENFPWSAHEMMLTSTSLWRWSVSLGCLVFLHLPLISGVGTCKKYVAGPSMLLQL